MPAVPHEQLVRLQEKTDCLRNICILAHVDHGKTSLSDCLLASNGIISPKAAGKIRFLDSREDEQSRGITMESSAISLYCKIKTPLLNMVDTAEEQEYLINLIDSPGHVDFSSEVSTASRLCDGALVLVDVVEGVCSQTVTVLQEVWRENLKPILIFNKMDRLITELRLSPSEAYSHLSRLLEQVNAVLGGFFAGDRMKDDLLWREAQEQRLQNADHLEAFEEKDDEELYFLPERGNVVFASAANGWAFTISQFADFYEKKLGLKKEVLNKVLWGDFHLDAKSKRVLQSKHSKGRVVKPMFVQFVLDNIWAVYDCTVIRKDIEKIDKIVAALSLRVLPRDLRSKDSKGVLWSIFSQWLPLSATVLLTVIQHIPSPIASQASRTDLLFKESPSGASIPESIKHCVSHCNFRSAFSLAYVSKMVSVPISDLPKFRRKRFTAVEMRERGRQLRESSDKTCPNDEAAIGCRITRALDPNKDDNQQIEFDESGKQALVGFARLYSGSLSIGDKLLVLGPKFDLQKPGEFISEFIVSELYMFMGRDLVSLDRVPAGNIFGIGGAEKNILKNATICSSLPAPNMASAGMNLDPIVRVAVEPSNPREVQLLERGLRLLNQADPCVQVLLQENGQLIILTAGELHLERCLKDLKERFAKIDIQSSEPVVPFRETIVESPALHVMNDTNLIMERIGKVEIAFAAANVNLQIRVVPLPLELSSALEGITSSMRKSMSGNQITDNDLITSGTENVAFGVDLSAENFHERFHKFLIQNVENVSEFTELYADLIEDACSLGPRKLGPNLLIDRTGLMSHRVFLKKSTRRREQNHFSPELQSSFLAIEDAVVGGFQLATLQGPLCNEPLYGVACILENVSRVDDLESSKMGQSEIRRESTQTNHSHLSGQIITSVRDSIRQCFLAWSSRLMLAMYSSDVLGKVYSVVARRKGRIVAEEMKEGTPYFSVNAVIPAYESFGFAEDIRKRTSGAASPQLIFAGFEILEQDPFWVPSTTEELEDLGEFSDRENLALKYVNDIRRRKGLVGLKRTARGAEKQRTLKK